MQHLNSFRFYELGAKLHALFDNATGYRVTEMFSPVTEAQTMLDGWIKGDPYPLVTSKDIAEKLLGKLGDLFAKYYIDPSSKRLKTTLSEDRIDAHEMALIAALVEKFEHALAAELSFAPIYKAQKRGIYSTYDLIENAAQSFSETQQALIPQASLDEFSLAGRALAFGLGTAASVHLLRALEIILQKYYEVFRGPVAKSEALSYAAYLNRLITLCEDEAGQDRSVLYPDRRLLQMLAQIKEHYRNPLTEPEAKISVDQALSLFSLATAAMTMMSDQIHARKGAAPLAPVRDDVQALIFNSDQMPIEDSSKKNTMSSNPPNATTKNEKEKKDDAAKSSPAQKAEDALSEVKKASKETLSEKSDSENYDFTSVKAG